MNSPEYMRDYQLKNKERLALYKKEYNEKHRESINQKKRDDYYQNLEVHKLRIKQYRELTNYDFKGYAFKYKEENKEKLAQYRKEYKTLNRDKVNANNAKRRASRLLRTPKWLDDKQIEQIVYIYNYAMNKTCSTGIKHHVDHIVPLQGKTVSGLHVPWNLQVLPEPQNISKSNKNWPDNW